MKNNLRGFTLIELILAISLMAITFTVTSDILISLIKSQSKTQVMNNVEEQASFIMTRIENDLRNAGGAYLTNDGDNTGLTIQNQTTKGEVGYYIGGAGSTVDDKGLYYWYGGDITKVVELTDRTDPGGVRAACPEDGGCFSVSEGTPQVVNVSIRFTPSSLTSSSSPVNLGVIEMNDTIVIRGSY